MKVDPGFLNRELRMGGVFNSEKIQKKKLRNEKMNNHSQLGNKQNAITENDNNFISARLIRD